MFFITLLGLILRLTNIIKLEGLWNDEYVSWMVASTPFRESFWGAVLRQCHMPLYYLYLKPFSESSDLVLRLTSVAPSVLSIIVMYFAGKEYSRKAGIFAASIASTLSFLVYYAQEVRFYSLIFLLSAISLLFTIKIIKNANKINIYGYLISSVLIVFTHVLGIVYVVFNTLYIIYKKRVFSKKILLFSVCMSLILIFLGINIIEQLPSSQWWGHFSYTNILFLFSDFLSPILTNHINAPPIFFYNPKFAIWLIAPTFIGIIGIIFGLKQNKGFACVSVAAVIVLSLLAIFGKIVFITKYAIEILPIIIIILSYGFVKMKRAGLVLFALFISFHLASFFTPNYVTKIQRTEGHKIVGDILNSRKPQKVIFTYYSPDRFYRYWDKNNAETLYISKINRFEYMDNPSEILENIKPGESVSVVFLDSVSFFPEEYLQKNSSNLPEMFVTFSHIKNILLKELDLNYNNFIVDKKGSWTVITAKKKKT